MVDAFEAELLEVLPRLRATAVMFTRDRTAAGDLLQESIVLALAAKHRYTLGTNMHAWMYRLMRNRFISLLRQRKAPSVPLDDPAALAVGVRGGQEDRITQIELERELASLPTGQREALLLVAAAGQSYAETADALGCTVDTVKCRVSRARARLRSRFGDHPALPAGCQARAGDDFPPSQERKPDRRSGPGQASSGAGNRYRPAAGARLPSPSGWRSWNGYP